MCVRFGRPCHPTPAPLSCFPGKQEEDVGRELFSQVASIHMCTIHGHRSQQPTPSGCPGTAYNLHVTQASYFAIYCVCEERGARCRVSSCWYAVETQPLTRSQCKVLLFGVGYQPQNHFNEAKTIRLVPPEAKNNQN